MKDVIDAHVHRFDLRFRLLDGANETERAERNRSADRNYRDLLPFDSQFLGDGFDRRRALLATGDADGLSAEQFIDGEAARFQSFMLSIHGARPISASRSRAGTLRPNSPS